MSVLDQAKDVKYPAAVTQDEGFWDRFVSGAQSGAKNVTDFARENVVDPFEQLMTKASGRNYPTEQTGPLKKGVARENFKDEKTGLSKFDPRAIKAGEDSERLSQAGDYLGEKADEFAAYMEENPEAFLEIAGGLEDSLLAPSRNKLNAANVLAANFGLKGKIGVDNAPSSLDRLGRNMVSDKLEAQEAQKQEAQKKLNSRYEALLQAQAGYLDRKKS